MPIDFGAHHRLNSSGVVHASNTMRAGPLKVRVYAYPRWSRSHVNRRMEISSDMSRPIGSMPRASALARADDFTLTDPRVAEGRQRDRDRSRHDTADGWRARQDSNLRPRA